MGVEIRGLGSLIAKLNILGGSADECMRKGIGKSMTVIEGDAKDLCPVGETGELRDSIHSETKIIEGIVLGECGTNKEYAAYQEFGTGQRGAESPSPPKAPIGNGYREDWSGCAAQPYLYPSLMQNKETVKELCTEELNQEIRRLGGSV